VLVADPTKASELLDWRPQRSDPATIIDDAWRWYRKRFIAGETFDLRGVEAAMRPMRLDPFSEEQLRRAG
jgi:hypothetical protein